jgi:type I restriction enzyme M protein
MLTDSKLRAQVDQLWNKFWSGGMTNPLDAIEQFSYLLFLKRLDDEENTRERIANRLKQPFEAKVDASMRWKNWAALPAEQAMRHLRDVVFPALRTMGGEGSSFQRYMQNAELKINNARLLVEACRLIDEMKISQQQQDIQGDLYEYMLGHLQFAGRGGQFRTPRHIIRMMVEMVDPQPMERIGDLAAGTGGFLVNAYQYILEKHTDPAILAYDEQGWPHGMVGDKLSPEAHNFLQSESGLRGFDNDSGMTVLRIGSMNLMLHGIRTPQFYWADTLSKDFNHEREYDVILMNPPFKGAIDREGMNENLKPAGTTKTELLFLHLILRALDMGGRCAVIVPDGVLFGSSRAHLETRKKIIEENRLEGVVSMPSGVFKPYAGVSTAVLIFTRGAQTDRIWFYDMEADGFSLDDKRTPTSENNIPDLLECWRERRDAAFADERARRLEALKAAIEPLQAERLKLEAEIHRLTFEQVISATGDGPIAKELEAAKGCMEELETRLNPLKAERDKLSRQFWVTKEQVRENKYDLSASRYKFEYADNIFFENPSVTLHRMKILESTLINEISSLQKLIDGEVDG